ncbi:AAA family ATPase [Streptomyces sp. NPDC048508]|uniref:helix-turn-helix transcriptional regulator n=1 Tax=Streptomyces sp. NPDC048508 TaxID=3365561 RepID=UPI00371A1271
MLEREDELSRMRKALNNVREGSSGFILVTGSPGEGKTLLLSRISQEGRANGLSVITARGAILEQKYSFGIVRQILQSLLRDSSETAKARLFSGVASQARRILGEIGHEEDTQLGEVAVLDGIFWLLSNACQDKPLVLVLDDIHWADYSSLRFLAYLQPRLSGLNILVVASVRSGKSNHFAILDSLMLSNHVTDFIRLRPFTFDAVVDFIENSFGEAPEALFSETCYKTTRGNPLILRELVRAISNDNLKPDTGSAGRVLAIGSGALEERIKGELMKLTLQELKMVEILAVLECQADIFNCAALSGISADRVSQIAHALEQANLVRFTHFSDGMGGYYEFYHPLVRAAIYDQIDDAKKNAYHSEAAQTLVARHSSAESAAAHLFRVEPSMNRQHTKILRLAAKEAWNRGSPTETHAYLLRCLAEKMTKGERFATLLDAASAVQLVDLDPAARYLREAMELTHDPILRCQVGWALGGVLLLSQKTDEALTVWHTALSCTPKSEVNLRKRILASLINIPLLAPNKSGLLEQANELISTSTGHDPESHGLNSVLSAVRAFAGNPDGFVEAGIEVTSNSQSKISDICVPEAGSESWQVCSWLAMLMAEDPRAIEYLDQAVVEGHRLRSPRSLSAAYCFRGLGWLWKGDLAEAENDCTQAIEAMEMANVEVGRPFIGAFLAEALLERGSLDQAQKALAWVGPIFPPPVDGQVSFALHVRARILRLRGRNEEAVSAARLAGERWAAHGGSNPAGVPWRSELALALATLGRHDEALESAATEVNLARRWGAPRALGRALRVAGTVSQEANGISILRESVEILEKSAARLEFSKSLIEYGSVVRQYSDTDARKLLGKGLDIAAQCDAVPLIGRARHELQLAGARPRRSATGPDSLTPSERRIAEQAIQGRSNREIAQHFFVTIKTVEVHLSNTYRKLGISGRRDLAARLGSV